MRTVVLGEPAAELQDWLDRRRALGLDLFDEVWEGAYHVAPSPHRRHGDLDRQIVVLLHSAARAAGLWPSGPANIGEPNDYRVPDGAYFRDRAFKTFEPTAAIVVEIVSPGDESRIKAPFYFWRGVDELLIVDLEARTVEWFTRGTAGFTPADRSALLGLTSAELHVAIDWAD